jgi:hypothetical protein
MLVFSLTHQAFLAPIELSYYMIIYTVDINFNNDIIFNFINNRIFYYGNNTIHEKNLKEIIAIPSVRKLLSTARFPFKYCVGLTGYIF